MIKLINIAREVIVEKIETYGELQDLMKNLSKEKMTTKIVQKGKDVAVDTVLGLIPGGSAAKNAFEFIKSVAKKPDVRKTDTWLDRLDIDDDMSSIVADDVEENFLRFLAKDIEGEPGTKKLDDDFDINQKMRDYLKMTYNNRTIDVKGIDLKKKSPGGVFG
tara:strand:+ start:114 stop:599 length:486 start_codon:yes stop_codon:yes gene_type:complete